MKLASYKNLNIKLKKMVAFATIFIVIDTVAVYQHTHYHTYDFVIQESG